VKKYLLIIVSAILFLPAAWGYALEVPELKGRVNDYADMISPETESLLDERLKSFETSDSTQIVILTVNSLEGDALEDFTIRVAEKWKIGQTKKDNGVILFASKNDRRMRIEVGRGLEGVLTDLLSGRILDNVIRPKFKNGDYDGGFLDGTGSIIEACRGEFKNDSPPVSSGNDSSGNLPIIFFFVLYFAVMLASRVSKILSGSIGAAGLPAIVHFGLFPIGLTGIIISAIAGFILALIFPHIPIGGGYSSGSSGGGSSFGGGGFSGGGGSFGGGGSSGGW